jgi:hypothetical protein
MPAPELDAGAASNAQIVRRLLRLSWRYRYRSTLVFSLQVVLLALTLWGLGLTGLAVTCFSSIASSNAA